MGTFGDGGTRVELWMLPFYLRDRNSVSCTYFYLALFTSKLHMFLCLPSLRNANPCRSGHISVVVPNTVFF